jgi:SAM-dependent methyltransferase
VRRWGLERPRAVLDVGCGAGHWGRTLGAALPGEPLLAGIDIEEEFLGRARELAAARGLPNVDYRVGAADAIPFPDGAFDVVTGQTVLIHVPSAEAALSEMLRVLEPDGLLVLAEPNNVAGHLSTLMAEPRPPWDVIHRQLDFYHVCLIGKAALGMGDSSVGERLPELLRRAGLRDVTVALNENTPALIPPYDEEDQAIERDFVRSCLREEVWWMGFGPRENARRFFLAGGGDQAAFAERWNEVMDLQRSILRSIDENRYCGGRAAIMYLIAARK